MSLNSHFLEKPKKNSPHVLFLGMPIRQNSNAKSTKTVMVHPEHYGPTKCIKIGDDNAGENGDIFTIPHYMTFSLGKRDLL